MSQITDKLYYKGLTFYFTHVTNNNDRIYQSLDELHIKTIITANFDYDGVLIAKIDESLREFEKDDLIRHFDSITGIEQR